MLPQLPSAAAFDVAVREHLLRRIRHEIEAIVDDLRGLSRPEGIWYGPAVDSLRERLDEDRRSLLLAIDDLEPVIATLRDWSRA